VQKQQGALTGGDYRRSLVIPFVTEIRGKKTKEQDRSQYCHKYMHVSQHGLPPLRFALR
jgi:hypothetical protein